MQRHWLGAGQTTRHYFKYLWLILQTNIRRQIYKYEQVITFSLEDQVSRRLIVRYQAPMSLRCISYIESNSNALNKAHVRAWQNGPLIIREKAGAWEYE